MSVNVSGVAPAFSGDDWVLFDETGTISFDKTVMAYIWLVGGGRDGGDGYTDARGFYHGGEGGRGGNVYKFGRIKLRKNTDYSITVGNENDPSGTSFKMGQTTFSSSQIGKTCALGGAGGIINSTMGAVIPARGKRGVRTPYGFVGSSGSGGVCAAKINGMRISTCIEKGGKGAGGSRQYIPHNLDWESIKANIPSVDAVNYGCGGGGNTYCVGLDDINVKSHGMKGCVIIQYQVLENEDENSPECSIHYWNNGGGSK